MSDTGNHLTSSENWLRVLLVVVYALIFYVATIVLGLVVLINLVALLITGRRNEELSDFGQQTSDYIKQIMDYATLNRSDRPFPFGQWPDDADDEVTATPSGTRRTTRPPEPPPAQDAPQATPSASVRPPARTAPPEPSPLKSTAAGKTARKTTARKKTTRKKRSTKKTTGKRSGSDQS